jgi:hypothetical protein
MNQLWFRLFTPKQKRVELIDSHGDGSRLTLVAWQRDGRHFAPVTLDRTEATQMREALSRWLEDR